jgi:hypothetical protein
MVPIALKSSQPFWQSLIRPMLLISLGLHGLLLMLPTSSETKPEPPAEDKVSLTELPTENRPVAPPSARPSATPRLVVKPAVRPVIPPPPRRVDAPPPLRSTTSPPQQLPRVAQPSTPAQPTPTAAAATTSPSPGTAAPIAPTAPTAPPADPFTSGFPIYPSTQPGSFGLPSDYDASSRRTDDDMEKVNDFYVNGLSEANYVTTAVEQAGRTVYQVTKADQTRYLTLIPNPEGNGTSIILSNDLLPMDLAGGSVESPAVGRFYSELPIPPDESWQDVSEVTQPLDAIMASSTDFFTSLGGIGADGFSSPPELRAGNIRGVVGAGDPDTVYASLQSQLQAGQFTTTAAGSYGGGSVYEVSRTDQYPPNEQVVRYLVLVPTLDGTKTFIFVWDRAPGS